MPQHPDPDGRQRVRHTHRLPHVTLETLNNWIREHRGRPYPTKSEKAALRHTTGLDARQIDTWFANTRRRRKDNATVLTNTRKDYCTSPRIPDVNSSGILLPSIQGTSTNSTIADEASQPTHKRVFCCTFCPDSFASKYDWTRHETSVHLSLKRYICCPFSPFRGEVGSISKFCVYCGLQDPTDDHIESHNHGVCQSRPPEARIFSRKDHLRQHMRSVHECELLPHMSAWLLQAEYVNSRCGFCGERFTDWSARNTHIATHFKQGSQMELWKGCRGLDTAVSAQVTAAMPSFLIGFEKTGQSISKASKMTYSSSRYDTDDDKIRNIDGATRWDVLVRELQTFVMLYSAQGFTVSDAALRHHARYISSNFGTLLDSTAADHPEWLDTFKRAYCLDALPGCRSPQAKYDDDDLDVHHDLGLTMPYLQCQRAKALHILFLNRGPVRKSGRRFSSIAVPLHKALPFETITGPWPDAGTLGQTIVICDQVFSSMVQAQIKSSLTTTQSVQRQTIATGEEELCWPDQSQPIDWIVDMSS